MRRMCLAAALIVALAAPLRVGAQERHDAWGGRAFVAVAAGVQTASPDFGYEYSTPLFDESARAGLDIPGKRGMAFDISGGVRLVRNFGVGVTYSRYSKERTAVLSTTIPSPASYNDASTVERQIPLQRDEDAVHIQAIYRIPIANRLHVGVFGGPTYFRCLDDTVAQFALEGDWSDDFEWSIRFRDVTQTIEKDLAWGYHGGADVVYMVTGQIGLRATMRYSRASHTTENPFSDTNDLFQEGVWGGSDRSASFTMKHGGMHWNGGISFRF